MLMINVSKSTYWRIMNKTEKILKYKSRVNGLFAPVSIQAGITDFCFNECHMCGHHQMKDKKNIDAGEWIGFLKHHPDIETVCYSGGDPLAHPDINRIMCYHLDSGTPFGLITAGFAPSYVDMELLNKARFVSVSLDSLDKDIYKQVRGGIKLDRVMDSFCNMMAYGCNIRLGVTVSPFTEAKIMDVINLATHHNIELTLHPVYGEKFTNRFKNILSHHQIGPNIILDDYEPLQKYGCAAVYYQSYIDSRGDIYPCCLTAGDTKSEGQMKPLGNIDNWDRYLVRRRIFHQKLQNLPDVCNGCIKRFNRINEAIDSQSKKSFF